MLFFDVGIVSSSSPSKLVSPRRSDLSTRAPTPRLIKPESDSSPVHFLPTPSKPDRGPGTMAFHQGYGAPQRQYNMLGDDSRYPQTVGAGTAAQNPFESQSSMQPGYPPTHQAMYDAPHGNDSTWSVHDYGQSPFGDDATKETAVLQRGCDNPYASDYRKPRSAGSWKKWTLIGLVVLLVVGGIAGGIAGWRVSANNKDNSASGTSSSGGSGKMQYSESLPRAQNARDTELHLSLPFFLPTPVSRWNGQSSQVEPARPVTVRKG